MTAETFLTDARIRAGAAVLLVLVGAYLLVLSPSKGDEQARPTGPQITATAIGAVSGKDGATVTGGYLPGTGAVLTLRADTAIASFDTWLADKLGTVADTVAELPEREALVWSVYNGKDVALTQIRMAPHTVTKPDTWVRADAVDPGASTSAGGTANVEGNTGTPSAGVKGSTTPTGSTAPSATGSATATSTPSGGAAASASATPTASGAAKDSATPSASATSTAATKGSTTATTAALGTRHFTAQTAYWTPQNATWATGSGSYLHAAPKPRSSTSATVATCAGASCSSGGEYTFVGGNALPREAAVNA